MRASGGADTVAPCNPAGQTVDSAVIGQGIKLISRISNGTLDEY
jgi:hypothetical protein